MVKRAWVPWAIGGVVVGGALAAVRYLANADRGSGVSDGGTGPETHPGLSIARTGDRIVLVGDSIGMGLSVPLTAMLKTLGVTLVTVDGTTAPPAPLVIKGVTAKGLLSALKGHAGALKGAHTVLLSLGSNDAAMNDPNVEVQAVEQLIALLRSTGAQVVWISPPNFRLVAAAVPPPATEKKQNQFDAILTTGLVDQRIVPNNAVIAELSPADRVHLTPKGYTAYASQIASEMTGSTGGA